MPLMNIHVCFLAPCVPSMLLLKWLPTSDILGIPCHTRDGRMPRVLAQSRIVYISRAWGCEGVCAIW